MKKYIIAAFLLASFLPLTSYALGTVTHFGGKITNVQTCTCVYDYAFLITVNDYMSGKIVTLKYSPWYSWLNMYYNVFSTGPIVLGGSQPGFTTCLVQSGYYCSSNGNADAVIDYIRGVGTTAK